MKRMLLALMFMARLSLHFQHSGHGDEDNFGQCIIRITALGDLTHFCKKNILWYRGPKIQSCFLAWGHPGPFRSRSAGPEKWSWCSQNFKIERQTGLQSAPRSRGNKPVLNLCPCSRFQVLVPALHIVITCTSQILMLLSGTAIWSQEKDSSSAFFREKRQQYSFHN